MELSPNRALEIIDQCRHLADAGLLTTDDTAEIIERLRTLVEHANPAAATASARGPSRVQYQT